MSKNPASSGNVPYFEALRSKNQLGSLTIFTKIEMQMTRFFQLITLLACTVFLNGCFATTEEIWIEADGSGRLESQVDMSGLYPLLMMGLNAEEEEETVEGEESDKFEDRFMAMLKAGEEVDTTFNMGQILAKELAKEGMPEGMSTEELIDALYMKLDEEEGMTEDEKQMISSMLTNVMGLDLRLQASSERQELKYTTIQRFGEPLELSSWMDDLFTMMSMMDEAEGETPIKPDQLEMVQELFGSTTRYELEGNTLRVHRSGLDFSSLEEEGDPSMAEMMPMIKMFLGNEPYRMLIHLPGKVRKISHPDAEKVNRTTVALEIPMDDLFDPEMELDFTIKFKRPRS